MYYKRTFPLCKWQAVWLFLLAFTAVKAQSAAKGFKALSKPEKHWVMMHPFIAKKAYRITEHVRQVTDSLQKAGVLADGNGGQLDAFRHAYWMAELVQHISWRKAEKLGKAHEKGNYLGWKEGKLEDATRPDSLMCDMDLKNNLSGLAIGNAIKHPLPYCSMDMSKDSVFAEVLESVLNGSLVMMKKDESGNFYDCEGNMIDFTIYDGKWYIPKCEVKSNESVKRG